MKPIKWIIFIFLGLITALIIFSSTQPNHLQLQESIIIDAPREIIFKKVSDYREWKHWHPWFEADSNLKNIYSEKQQQLGATNEWISETAIIDNGIQKIIDYKEDSLVENAIVYHNWDDTSYQWFILRDTLENKTYFTWAYQGTKTPFYMNFMNLIMEPLLRKNYKKGVRTLKKHVESLPKAEVKPTPNPRRLEIVTFDSTRVVTILDSCPADQIGKKLTELYTEITIFIEMDDGIEIDGRPMALYHDYSEKKVILEAAIPYKGNSSTSDRIQLKTIAAKKSIKGKHYGDETSEALHFAILDYAAAKKLKVSGSPWEIYQSGLFDDESSEQKIYVYYPVQ